MWCTLFGSACLNVLIIYLEGLCTEVFSTMSFYRGFFLLGAFLVYITISTICPDIKCPYLQLKPPFLKIFYQLLFPCTNEENI